MRGRQEEKEVEREEEEEGEGKGEIWREYSQRARSGEKAVVRNER